MPQPQRPAPISTPRRETQPTSYRDASSRRQRPTDLEASPRDPPQTSPYRSSPPKSSRRPAREQKTNKEADVYEIPSPLPRTNEKEHYLAPDDMRRQKSLVRPERRRLDPSDPNYHYQRHAQKMAVMPSATGLDPTFEHGDGDAASESTDVRSLNRLNPDSPPRQGRRVPMRKEVSSEKGVIRKMPRKSKKAMNDETIQKKQDGPGPSVWIAYCHIITFWCPDAILKCFGKPQRAQQRAWREKMGLISIIILIAAFVGFLTFGFTEAVCPSGGPERLRINQVGSGYMIFHGQAYNLLNSKHPQARGIPNDANILFDLNPPHGGQDGSFLFQNVNGACKGQITLAEGSDVPTNNNGDLAWYFPCTPINQDGSSPPPNGSAFPYLGYSCHTSDLARSNFYGLKNAGDVYFDWSDVKNETRNLVVYNGNVIDLDLIRFFNSSQVSYPARWDTIRSNDAIKGLDMSRAWVSSADKQMGRCFQDIMTVGSVDTETVGCIASKVVLYVSLIFILSIVAIKFLLALIFQWILCKRYAATKTSYGGQDDKQRKQQIEAWSDDIYRAPPKLAADMYGPGDRSSKRASFLPTTSRFTSPYEINKSARKSIVEPTTMASQSSSSKLNSGQLYKGSNNSMGNLPTYMQSEGFTEPSRSSLLLSGTTGQQSGTRYSVAADVDGHGPAGFIHEAVVPQPPPEWQPFGYPLAHAICLVTAYSEGADGIRTTLDSVATTDYPNSHKLMLVICDGLIKGKGESMSTPEICLGMMKDHAVLPEEVQAFSYVAVASGSKRHNMAKIYSGFYDYGENSMIPADKQQRVPMMIVVKCGTPDEAAKAKPGNRGKRDSQIILMSFLQKVMFDERMTELEFEMFNGIWKITGISPDFYEIVLMVDADTKVFPDSLTHMISAMVKDPDIMGLCGETKIANKRASWVSMIQVFEYFISHHLSKSFESVFGGVTCLPGCFCMYRIKSPKGGQNYWVPILANPDVVEHYSENVVDTLHKKNLLLLGEDRYLSTLMLRTFPKRKQVFIPQAVCKTTVPDEFKVLLSQRRRWINSTVHNLMELVLVRDLCGTFCFSMQFVVFIELVGTLVLPAAIAFTFYVVALGIKAAITHTEAPVIPLVLLALILGLPGVLIVLTAHRFSYVAWMFVYLLSLPIWNFVLPTYAYWKFDDFSWGDTRKTSAETKTKKAGIEYEGEFDSSKITMKRWGDFESERRVREGTIYSGSNKGLMSASDTYLGSAPLSGSFQSPSSIMSPPGGYWPSAGSRRQSRNFPGDSFEPYHD